MSLTIVPPLLKISTELSDEIITPDATAIVPPFDNIAASVPLNVPDWISIIVS